MLFLDDTIAAIASAAGGAARGIVRMSGPGVLEIASQCFQSDDATVALANMATPTVVAGHVCGTSTTSSNLSSRSVKLPAKLFLWPTSRSYTRQPMAEFHTFGSPPLLDWMLQTLCTAGARLAQPGEFTLRAFLAGRIDLTQAEAVLGVVDATDRRQLDSALAQLAGGLSKPLRQLRDELLNLLADLEAGLDFVEEDIRFVGGHELVDRLADASQQLDALLQQLGERTDANQLPRVVLVGWPNVGKSSLFNALAQNEFALVSPLAGTTRDYLSAKIHCGDLEVELIDTAGIDETDFVGGESFRRMSPNMPRSAKGFASYSIDQAAQQAAAGQHRQADLLVLCLDMTRPMNDWERQQLAPENTLVAWTKCDLAAHEPSRARQEAESASATPPASLRARLGDKIFTSSRNGNGLPELRAAIAAALSRQPGESSAVAGTAARARESIRLAARSIGQARQLANDGSGEELIAAELRTALEELGKVVGAIYTDDLLDRIFSRFCIGK